MTSPTWRSVLRVAACVVCLVLTAAAYRAIPTRVDTYAPIIVHGVSPGTTQGRNITVNLQHVYVTRAVRALGDLNRTPRESDGRWVTVDGTYESVLSPGRLAPTLEADGRLVKNADFSGVPFGAPGLAQQFTMTFEVVQKPTSLAFIASDSQDFALGKYGNFIYSGFRRASPSVDSELRIEIPPSTVEYGQLITLDMGGKVVKQ